MKLDIKCPKCKKIFATLKETRTAENGRTWYFYNCEMCGHSWDVEDEAKRGIKCPTCGYYHKEEK